METQFCKPRIYENIKYVLLKDIYIHHGAGFVHYWEKDYGNGQTGIVVPSENGDLCGIYYDDYLKSAERVMKKFS